jgi:hypothetical protein
LGKKKHPKFPGPLGWCSTTPSGYRYPLCEITGIFPYKYPVFAFYTGFIK